MNFHTTIPYNHGWVMDQTHDNYDRDVYIVHDLPNGRYGWFELDHTFIAFATREQFDVLNKYTNGQRGSYKPEFVFPSPQLIQAQRAEKMGEPFFVISGLDQFALHAMDYYIAFCRGKVEPQYLAEVEQLRARMYRHRQQNSKEVHFPPRIYLDDNGK